MGTGPSSVRLNIRRPALLFVEAYLDALEPFHFIEFRVGKLNDCSEHFFQTFHAKHTQETAYAERTQLYNARPWLEGWSSLIARKAHNLKAAGSNPAPA